ncbi:MAG: diaminopimelate epimerase [Desulfuromonas sp.]|nr:MAG: diaminopimelate epimerase [Desulfuromonas sp.]
MKFVKMQGAGNDYVYVDGFRETIDDPEQLAIAVSDRHFGIGSDGLILILPSESADLRMRMFNADGSEAEMCGNGVRCVAKYAYDHGLIDQLKIRVETGAGILPLQLFCNPAGKVEKVQVSMGVPQLAAVKIPLALTSVDPYVEQSLNVGERTFAITCVSMGNPHCVIYVDDVDSFPVDVYGPLIENHPLFPRRINVEFVQVLSPGEVKQRTWERGAGETLACGTGASAVTVAGVLTGRSERCIVNHLRGGDLQLEWSEEGTVLMTGPAVEVFSGEYLPQ